MKIGSTLNGIIVYEKLPDGCLNGVFSNNHKETCNKISNEIAKRKSADDETDLNMAGDYYCCYMEDGKAYMRDLTITYDKGRYDLVWKDQNDAKIVFTGLGWKTGTNQLTAMYWD